MRAKRSRISGEVCAPPSKSFTHRSLILAALSGARFEVRNPLVSDDTCATMMALSLMGARIEREGGSVVIDCPELGAPAEPIDVMNSGTTLRLVSGLAALVEGDTTLTGDETILRRPMKPLLDALRELGARCSGTGDAELPPVTIRGPMTGSAATLRGDISSQFVSSLLISCPMKGSETEIRIVGPQKSTAYVLLTLHILDRLGVKIERFEDGFRMQGGQRPKGSSFEVPGDFSSASFLLVASAVTDGEVRVQGLDPSAPQGDVSVLDALRRFGATVTVGEHHVECRAGGRNPIEFDVSDSPDLFPILAVMASLAEGESRLFGGEHLRYKESNRISTTVEMLRSMGVDAEARPDGCLIRGTGKIPGGSVDTHGDHRIMMSAVVAGLCSEDGVSLDDSSSHRVSYPGFLDDIKSLGAALQGVW